MIKVLMITTLSTSLCWAICSPSDYEEKDSLVVIEAENLAYHSDWVKTDTILDFTGSGYIQWEGVQNYGKVENGIIDISIKINSPGTYRFMHRVAIADMSEGTTEHNDSWLKIEANDFFAEREGHIVKPNPLCTTDSTIDCPEGKSDKGYFKMYGGNSTWKWAGNTNDNSAHQVFATFDTVGTYKLSIAARSSYQAIDRMILFHIDKDIKLAKDLNQPETKCTSLTNTPQKLSEHLQIKSGFIYNSSQVQIQIYNTKGELVIESNKTQIPLSQLQKGLYHIFHDQEFQTVLY